MSLSSYKNANQKPLTSTIKIPYSTWFHVVVVSGYETLNLYVNGTLVASSIIKDTFIRSYSNPRFILTVGNPELGTNSGDLYLSFCNTGETRTQSYKTVIGVDDLRFYSRELKLKEIQALANDDDLPTKYFFD